MDQLDSNGYKEFRKQVSKLPEKKRLAFLLNSIGEQLRENENIIPLRISPMESDKEGNLKAIKGIHYTVK